MPVVGNNENAVIGGAYKKSPLYAYAKAFVETADSILKEESYDFFAEPQKTLRMQAPHEAIKNFFMEGWYDPDNKLLSPEEIEDIQEQAEAQFNNDVKGMLEHSPIAEYNPIVGMALPIHKLILMNNVFDKGVA